MPALPYRYILPSVLLLSACTVAETAPPPIAMDPALAEVAVDSLDSSPAAPEPEMSLQERWRAPFAVDSRGRTPRREPPARVVVRAADDAPPPAREAESTSEPEEVPSARAASGRTRAAPAEADAETGTASAPAQPSAPAPAARPAARSDGAEGGRASAAAEARTHEVVWGETWLGIARRHGLTYSALQRANPGVDPDRLRTGQVLHIPPGAAAAPKRPLTHKVGPGDSLWGIARRYGVTMEQIRAANRLRDDRVRLGQTLTIPKVEENQ